MSPLLSYQMTEYKEEQLVVAIIAIFRDQLQQLYDRFKMENLEVNGTKVIFEEGPKELDEHKEIQMEDLKEAPLKFDVIMHKSIRGSQYVYCQGHFLKP